MPGLLTRLGRRALLHNRARVDRFKLASRAHVRARLLADERVTQAVREHAAAQGIAEREAWATVERYLQEIVPFFNVIAYYQIGYRVSRAVLNLFYKVSVDFEEPKARAASAARRGDRLPDESSLERRLRARELRARRAGGDLVRGRRVGARVSAGARVQGVRRRTSSAAAIANHLYHTVLERYVQLITRQGVTQGIFLEGGLTRDGKLRPPKIGLLDYVLGIAPRPGLPARACMSFRWR